MTLKSLRLIPLSLLPTLFSCGSAPEPTTPAAALAVQTQALSEGTSASIGMLSFLNSTTLTVLDTEVPLNALAAQNIMAYRAGPDGVLHTADDRRFVSVAQVDAVPQVGPATMDALELYVRGTGRVEMPLDEQVGTFDGVPFNLAEARRVLAAANSESASVLQTSAGLSVTAAQALVAARPIPHLVKLSRLAPVDGTVLQQLKTFVQLAPEGDPCTGAGTCQAGLVCEGVPGDGSSPYGRCRGGAAIPGDNASCSALLPCQEGLVCHGLASGSPEGICRPEWMSGSFTRYADLPLHASTATVESTVAAVGLATVPEDITVVLDLVHTSPSKLVLTLVDPGGETALLWDGPNEGVPPARISVTRGIPRDGAINGRWLLRVQNPSGMGSGTLRAWTVELTSRYD
ncbi:proprotein convertase P-domain-containing protein [Myxococcaceae bacterium GXIMD 01537]